MGIELYWDNDAQTIMLCEIEGRWTWDDLFETMGKVKTVTDRAGYDISAIVDIRSGASIPGGTLLNARNLENARKLAQMGDDGTGLITIVGANGMVRTAYQTIARLYPRATENIYFAENMGDAREFIAQRQAVPAGM